MRSDSSILDLGQQGLVVPSVIIFAAQLHFQHLIMNDFGMRSLSEDSSSNLNHIHVESLCETVSDFLERLDGVNMTSSDLIEKRLSESEVAILECGLIVADIKNISEDIDNNFIQKLESDRNQLNKVLSNLERISESVMPQLEGDLNAIQELVDALELRYREFSREQSIGWIKKFLPTGTVKPREEHTKYAHQVASCKLHSTESLLRHFDEPTPATTGDCASSISNSSGAADTPDSSPVKGPGGDYETL